MCLSVCKHCQSLDAPICLWICVGSLYEAFGCWVNEEQRSGRERWWGGPDLADDSVNGVITSVPLSVQYKREVTHQAELFSSLPSSLTSVTFTHLLLFVGGELADLLWSCSVWVRVVCVGVCVSVARLWHTNRFNSCVPELQREVVGEVPSFFFSSYANLIMFYNPCLLFALCKYCLCGTSWQIFPIKPLFLGIS